VSNSSGWWNTIAQVDLDKDGNMDFVVGNWGLNSRFKASVEKPMQLYVNDFDGNGTSEGIIAYYWPEGKSFVYPSKSDMTSQLPPLRKKFLYYKDFAGKTMDDFFGADAVSKSQQYKTEELQTAILWGKGDGETELKPLPVIAQVAPVYSIVANDFDRDGNLDLLLTGNMYDLKPDVGRLDANDGIVLKGNGKRDFYPLSSLETGVHIKGQVRDAVTISTGVNKQTIILARNNSSLLYLELKK
jgi:enediyne biosynthesis protein E4